MGASDDRPWLKHYGDVPACLEYPDVTLHGALEASARDAPEAIALDFEGRHWTYGQLLADVERCAAGLAALGLGRGDRITLAMPTMPQGVVAFFAAIKLGAVPAMVHPLSTPAEIELGLRQSCSRFALALDALHAPFLGQWDRTPLERLVLASVVDALPPVKRLLFAVSRARSLPKAPADPHIVHWREVVDPRRAPVPTAPGEADDVAAILYSGGTTGLPKGIGLTHRNFIACARQVAAWGDIGRQDAVLAILPLFHGFGLGVCVVGSLMAGSRCILVPKFTPADVARRIRRDRPTLLVGVPTLYEALTRESEFMRADLAGLRAAFSGADTLPRPVKQRFEACVRERGGDVRLLEGYGLTEAVSACMAMPLHEYREGSIGVPFPDVLAKICHIGTTDEVPPGEEGEICISGPAVMRGYIDAPEENAATLRRHGDGRTWLHTGDLGRMDADGFFYFVCRLKRMIKSSGFNVYPAQVEAVLYRHPAVLEACVVGVPDEAQVERVKAFVVARPGVAPGPALEAALIEHCRAELIKWSCPREVEFRASLPRTRVGKVDFRALRDRAA